MKLADLFEAKQFEANITAEKALELLQTKCKDADLSEPIIRGMTKRASPFNVIQGEAGHRQSRNTSNYYTLIFDHVLTPLGYPKRSASIICSSWTARSYAMSAYGDGEKQGKIKDSYAIVPFDGVKIGVCPEDDMFQTKLTIGNKNMYVVDMNELWKGIGASQHSYDFFIESLDLIRTSNKSNYDSFLRWLIDWIRSFDSAKALEEAINNAYRPENCNLRLATTKTASIYADDHEVWIGGECLAIQLYEYYKLVEKLENEL